MISEIQAFRVRSLATLAIGAIGIYQHTLSKVTPAKCRFFPSCSQYAIEAIKQWGVWEGVRLTEARISRCRRPNGGFDPVHTRHDGLSSQMANSHTDSTFDILPNPATPEIRDS